jgi:DNA-directed RNA polymerase specialized sigma24 family protein
MPTQVVCSMQSSESDLDGRAPGELSILELARNCSEETSRLLKDGTSDGRYCLELFRRAVALRDEDAWACLYQQYAPLVLTWVKQHQSAAPLVVEEGAASLVNAAFAKFAAAMTPAKIERGMQLVALLHYLKLCVRSVIVDAVRLRRARKYEELLSIEEHDCPSSDPAEDVVTRLSAQVLWQAILAELDGEQERVVVYLVCIHGLKPREITSLHRRLFPSVADVYRIKRNALERLRRNARLQGFAHGEEGAR